MSSKLNLALENKVYALLGFAQKAGKLISGDDSVFAALKQHQAQLVILAQDLSENSRDKFEQKMRSSNKTEADQPGCYVFGNKQKLGHAIGKSPRGMIVVTDRNFAQAMSTYLNELN